MKKVLLVVLGVAVALTLSSAAFAKSAQFVEKERSKIDTGAGTEKIKTTAIENGQFTTEKGKVIFTPHRGDVKVEKLTFKAWNENDPTNNSDNTVIMYKGKEEFQRLVSKDMKVDHLTKLKKAGTIYSTYNPLKYGWEITAVEE